MSLKGRVALVTGGTKGIGRAIALRLASKGADVAVNYFKSRDAATATVEEIQRAGVRAVAARGNVGNDEHLAKVFDEVKARTPGRPGTPEDVAPVVAWLCGDEAAWVQGQLIVADGGYSLH